MSVSYNRLWKLPIDKDILGRTYKYGFSKFAKQEGKRAGEFYTPSCVVRTLFEVLQPFKGRVYEIITSSSIQSDVSFCLEHHRVHNHLERVQRQKV